MEEYSIVDPDSALDAGLFLTKEGGYLPLEVILSRDYKGNPEDEFKGYGNGVFRYIWLAGPAFRTAFIAANKLDEVLRNPNVERVRKISIED